MRCASRGLVANSTASGTAAAVQRARSTPWPDTAHGRSGHGPCHWHRPGKHRSDSSRPAVPEYWSATPADWAPFFKNSSMISTPSGAVLDHITATQVARLGPQDMRQNPLGAPGSAVPDRFGQLPAVLALGRAPS